jgi:glycosyltransferase involved in cell wall biosynthesis
MPVGIGMAGWSFVAEEQHSLKVLIVTDAWTPQVNGVVRTLEVLGRELSLLGHEVRYVTPQGRISIPLPTYSEIRLALFAKRELEDEIRAFAPDAIHIATEGTLGFGARSICLRYNIPFTTSFHTRFPEYVTARFPFVKEEAVYRFLRWFHGPATAMMVATPTLEREMEGHGFKNLRIWSRGVDTDLFRPLPGAALPFPHPIWLYVGRIAVEKNIEAFLKLDLPGTKVLVGDGPARGVLSRAYPNAKFLGPRTGEPLVEVYAASDVFVFPSRTDTFGLVLLEALACGTPVAAYPVQGPLDVIGNAKVGVLDGDLGKACKEALALSRDEARAFAVQRNWRSCTEQFLANLAVDHET